MKFNIHAGHGLDGSKSCGAIGLVKESTEARKIKNEVIRLLKQEGHIVHDTTVDYPVSASDCINQIVKKCNSNKVDLDISIHLNSGRKDSKGDGKTGGVEVLVYDNKSCYTQAKRVADKIAGLGYSNRGVKIRTDLGVLRNTKAPALLIECFFVDDKDDVNKYDYKKMAKAIAEGILNKTITEQKPTNSSEKMIKIQVDGKIYDMEGVLIDGCNYLKVRELEKANYKIGFVGSMATIDKP